MTEAVEGSFPDSADNLETHQKKTLIKQAAVWFRIDGLLDRMLAALKDLAALIMRLGALITKMESRSARGPPDYEMGPAPGIYVDYGDRRPAQEPSWQNKVLSIVGSLVVAGILAIFGVLWSMNSRLSDLRGDTRVTIQRLDAQDKHMEATDKQVEEIKRELWTRKH